MNEIEIKRETAKLGLQTFFMDVENNFHDRISDDAIKMYEDKVKISLEKDRTEEYEMGDYSGPTMECYFHEMELKAISEMKIIYAYKHFENKLKFLLGAAYGASKSKMYKWETVVEFLQEKGIDVKQIKCYDKISELRNLNNALKHSDSLKNDARVANIKELKNKGVIQYKDLLAFYKRVEDSPFVFISALANCIFNDLYVFDEKRIEKEAEKIALRMTEKEAKLLIKKLEDKY